MTRRACVDQREIQLCVELSGDSQSSCHKSAFGVQRLSVVFEAFEASGPGPSPGWTRVMAPEELPNSHNVPRLALFDSKTYQRSAALLDSKILRSPGAGLLTLLKENMTMSARVARTIVFSIQLFFISGVISLCASPAFGQAQSNAANLNGYVRDQQGAVVINATVTARNRATNDSRTGNTNDSGLYQVLNLTPGDYEVTVEAPNFKKAVLPTVKLTVGQRADLDVTLEPGSVDAVVTITGASTELVETSRTAVATTVDQQRIDNLPINERNYLSFALTTSTVGRDNGRPIGPAPTTGLNFGGQRGRSNLVQVDGADNTDNSVNASRSTVSQEAVQEFQVVTNSFAPEFGRSAGGVVNVVTKSGTNDFRGNVFGFIRDRRFQARNPFAQIAD